jgi:hypothetical protein
MIISFKDIGGGFYIFAEGEERIWGSTASLPGSADRLKRWGELDF